MLQELMGEKVEDQRAKKCSMLRKERKLKPKWNNGTIKTCPACSKEYYVPACRSITAKYCSVSCHNKNKATKRAIKNKRICKNCGKLYIPSQWYQKFCSMDCAFKHRRNKPNMKCSVCNKEFYPSRNGSKFCSPECYNQWRPTGKRKKKDWLSYPKKGKQTYLDRLWRDAIHVRADRKCEYCGKESHINAHHIFSRSNFSVRWDVDNGIALCAGHHVFGNFSAHKSPVEFVEWLKEKRGERWYEELRMKARKINGNMEELKNSSKEALEKMLQGTKKLAEVKSGKMQKTKS